MRIFTVLSTLLAAFFLPWTGSSQEEVPASETPLVWEYHEVEIEGWSVLVQEELYAKENLRSQVLGLMRVKLWEIATRLPEPSVARLQQVKLRMHLDHDANRGAAYHPNPNWLRQHGMPEDWALGVEFGNAKHFLDWSRQQPAMVLHELAHAWHHQVIGYDHQGILDSFATTKEAGMLDEVLYVSGGSQRAYGLNNEMEFFAEMSEAWWSTNDMYPFVRGEVIDGLPEVAKQMDDWWRLPSQDAK